MLNKKYIISTIKGFTLIELLVVIAILAILATIGIVIFRGALQDSQDARRKGDIDAIFKALEKKYDLASGRYGEIAEDDFTANQIPKTPDGQDYPITYSDSTKKGFEVCATLEDGSSFCKQSSQGRYISPPPPPPPSKKVFITSTRYNGNLGGIAGADQKCNDLVSVSLSAHTAVKGKIFKAWISGSTADSSPVSRFAKHNDGPYTLVDGTVVAQNWADLVDGNILHAITLDEKGGDLGARSVWTNTASDGTFRSSDYSCANWGSGSSLQRSSLGVTGAGSTLYTDSAWTAITQPSGTGCHYSAELYCFEQ